MDEKTRELIEGDLERHQKDYFGWHARVTDIFARHLEFCLKEIYKLEKEIKHLKRGRQ